MKKNIIIAMLILAVAGIAASCSQHNTCPAYRGSVAMAANE